MNPTNTLGAGGQVLDWKAVYSAELREISRIRRLRVGAPPAATPSPGAPPAADTPPRPTPEEVASGLSEDLFGLAFSGGGIRSATFNLGILEGLRDSDLLRRVDYLSTVSGGGYIGAWTVGNARRRAFWLNKGADWRASIEHLRKYSNYLSPRLGILSADTWNIATIWTRNTILIQLLVFLMISAVLMAPHGLKLIFEAAAGLEGLLFPAACLPLILSVAVIGINLNAPKTKQGVFPAGQRGTQGLAVLPLLFSSFLFAALMWDQTGSWTVSAHTYSGLLLHAWRAWWPVGLVMLTLIVLLSWSTCVVPNKWRGWFVGGCAAVTVAVLYAEICGVMLLLLTWHDNLAWQGGAWYASAFGPALVLACFTLTIVVMLGLLSRASREDQREWWSRLGAWQSIYTVAWLVVALGGLFTPLWVAKGISDWKLSAASGALGWLATTAGGVLAGKGESTGLNAGRTTAQKAKELLARVAPVVFIAGLVMALASVLHALLLYAVLPAWPRNYVADYWKEFDAIPSLVVWCAMAGIAVVAILYSLTLDINVFSLNAFYCNRLVCCYLGATRDKRHPQEFTQFDDGDDLYLTHILDDSKYPNLPPYTGPLPVVNCALNLGGSKDLTLHTRHSDCFTFTPLHAGSWREKVQFAPLKIEGKPYYAGAAGGPRQVCGPCPGVEQR